MEADAAESATGSGAGRTYQVRTYGCQMNVHDSERLAGLLEDAGYRRAEDGDDADVVVFDYDTLSDKAEFTAMNRPAEGVRHLIVSGVPVIADGVMDVAARPGRPVRRPAITR